MIEMTALGKTITTVICTMIASSGFWAFLQKKFSCKSIQSQMLIGLGHDRILNLGFKYIDRGWITQDEYENLNDYLYKPYSKMGGNGSAKRIMEEIRNLPIKSNNYKPEGNNVN